MHVQKSLIEKWSIVSEVASLNAQPGWSYSEGNMAAPHASKHLTQTAHCTCQAGGCARSPLLSQIQRQHNQSRIHTKQSLLLLLLLPLLSPSGADACEGTDCLRVSVHCVALARTELAKQLTRTMISPIKGLVLYGRARAQCRAVIARGACKHTCLQRCLHKPGLSR